MCFCASPLFGSIGVSARLSINKTSLLFLAHSLLLAVLKTEQCADFRKSNFFTSKSQSMVSKCLNAVRILDFCKTSNWWWMFALTVPTGQIWLQSRYCCRFYIYHLRILYFILMTFFVAFAFCILTDLLAITAATGQNGLHRRCKFLKTLNQPTADSDQRGRQTSEPRSN